MYPPIHKIPVKILYQFSVLACKLSPENLHCDGEISSREADRKYKKLIKEWNALEKQVGRTVTENEIWDWEIKKEL